MDLADFAQIEAYLRNWLIWLGKQTGLPLTGRDWEFAVLAVLGIIALWVFLWPTRRAFSRRNPVRWIVLALNLAAGWFWPLWVFALLLSGINPAAVLKLPTKLLSPRTAPAPGGVPAVLSDVVKAVQALAAKRQQGGGGLGPWGKQAKPPAPPSGASAEPARPAARTAAQSVAQSAAPRQHPATAARQARVSSVPNRQTWVRRR